ncbi:hypothetical protein [Sphingomonas sp. PB2P12]|uniref:hypothetical protein n=1 Tax=Sphingomonas sandaracina TaxID=3096157 RepID=UPI002FC88BA6
MAILALLLQSAAGSPVPRELHKLAPRVALPCPVTGPGEDIVVCARPTDQRLIPLAEPIRPLRGDPLSFRLPGGGTGNVHAIQTALPGANGQGAAVTLRIPFGKGKRQ